ncbi:MAG TPA: ABC transporter permease subunit [Acidimicrobiales bacterium]
MTARHRLVSLALLALMLVAWQVAHELAGTNQRGDPMVPGLVDVLDAFKGLSREWQGGWGVERTDLGGEETWAGGLLAFAYNAGATGLRLAAGYLLGAGVGLGLAALVSWSPLLRRIVYVPAHSVRMLPLLALIPLFGLWYGSSNTGAVMFVAFTVFVYVFAFGINAIANVPGHFSHAARSLGAGRVRTYVEVVLPAALPELGSGLSLSLALGWSAAISAEFNGQATGLGQIAYVAEYFTQTGLLALMAITVIAFAAASFLFARGVIAWATRWAE